ncbi:MAG: phosphoadenosine phosphosulfate reductase family protein [Candidatus Hodgkinia cicadicola]
MSSYTKCFTIRLIAKYIGPSPLLKAYNFVSQTALLTSLGFEDQLLLSFFESCKCVSSTIDTNLLFNASVGLLKLISNAYGSCFSITKPKWGWVLCAKAAFIKTNIHESATARLRCCLVRKVESIFRTRAVIVKLVGIRIPHSSARQQFEIAQWDRRFKHIKVCPVALWQSIDIMQYLWSNSICYNSLHDYGYKSIGCAPCTRAVKHWESARAGRWWWESGKQTSSECGLHTS